MLHNFLSSLARPRYLYPFSLSFSFIMWPTGTAKSIIRQVLIFFCWLSLDRDVWPRLDDLFVAQNLREVLRRILQNRFLFIWANSNFLHNSQWIPLATQSYLVLYSFSPNFLYSLIMWFISSLFDMISLYDVVVSCYWKKFSFLLKVSFFLPRPRFLMWDVTC